MNGTTVPRRHFNLSTNSADIESLFLWLQDELRRFTPHIVPLVRVERGRVVLSDRKYGISKDAASPDRLMLRGEIHITM
jgi:hypothetical protein